MTRLGIAQLSAALLAVCTPWIVASIALRVATTPAGAPAPHVHSMKLLRAMTVGAAIATSIATVILAPSLWMLLAVGLGFGCTSVVALRVLGEIDDLHTASPAGELRRTRRQPETAKGRRVCTVVLAPDGRRYGRPRRDRVCRSRLECRQRSTDVQAHRVRRRCPGLSVAL